MLDKRKTWLIIPSAGGASQKRDGKSLSPDLLAHVSPLGWEHINLTGEYRWPKP
ncbi:Tn3 family transposase [Ochrobactrum sp. BTU1]|nr:Tn3 family transposase [Ochrobactrum sp. BTU1]